MKTWRQIVWYEWLYEISNDWDIKSLVDNFWKKRERIMKTTLWNNWYLKICLYKNKKSHTKLVHRLLAQAFIKNPNNYPIILHIDNNKLNINLYNLKWWTIKENNNQIMKEWRHNFQTNHPDLWKFWWNNKRARKVNLYNLHWKFIKTFDCLKDWAEEIWINYNNICRACKDWWTAWWYKWSYLN